jgi:hypothetical protein
MRKIIGVALLLGLLLVLAGPVPSEARSHGHFSFGTSIWLGPGWWGPGWWGPPYHYSPPVVIQQPPVYVQPAPPPPTYWYYCQNPQGYYPYVQQCPGGWTPVTPTPPAAP